ncbi:hypothetical protein J416_13559 [Gracilibacillus halophilus YIM-C55.5]|uniref:Uncharacterized protein n=1 Tax=Gracilibacillus halophilus YIM-C55.5 TaxID=1308866 RepID=N4W9H8_9BACI|nr:hypothetical protein [Gracilibacillus halophilus]ENH95914.1 hypothetical protein J416_13559 [Gracilibacillus halophilus YIM-C55.5]
MGYIMPVENYQYHQYQNRVNTQEHDPMPIERLYPIQFSMQYNRQKTEERQQRQYSPDHGNQTIGKKRTDNRAQYKPNHQREAVYAEVTGKGGQFQAEV